MVKDLIDSFRFDDKSKIEKLNLQRENLNAIEEAQSYKKILDMKELTQEELAVRLGIAQSTIANKIRLLNLSIPVKDALLNNKISERHARGLLAVKDDEQPAADNTTEE